MNRESEIKREILKIARRYQAEYWKEIEPLLQELRKIEASKPPPPMIIDGKMYVYTGPLPKAPPPE